MKNQIIQRLCIFVFIGLAVPRLAFRQAGNFERSAATYQGTENTATSLAYLFMSPTATATAWAHRPAPHWMVVAR